jgi:hypothetical protein
MYLPPQLMEFTHLNGKSGPNFKDRRKAMIEQTHFSTHNTRQMGRRNAAMQKF